MEQNKDSAGQGEQVGERYEAARDWLAFLIDHPDKTVSVREYQAQLVAAGLAVTSAHVAMMAARA